MAFNITYIFEAVDKFTKVAKKVEKSVERIEKRVKGVNTRLNDFQKKGKKSFGVVGNAAKKAENKFDSFFRRQRKGNLAMRAFGAVLGNIKFRLASLAVTILTTGAGLNKIVDIGSKIQTSFINFSALTGVVGKDLEFLKDKAKIFSRVFGISAEDIFLGFKRIAGLKPELIRNVEALAELTKQAFILDAPLNQIETTSRALTVALNVYGKSVESASEFTNILGAASRFGSAEVDELALSFLKAGQVSTTVAKIPFLDLIATIETIAQKGLLAQISGTGLRTVIIRLQRAGLDFEKIGVEGVFAEVARRLDDARNATERAEVSFQLFGLRQQAVGLALAENVDLLKRIKSEIKDTDVALDTARKVLEAFAIKLAAVRKLLEFKFLDIFEEIGPQLIALQKQVNIFFEVLDVALPGGIKGTLNFLLGTLTKIAEIINVVILGISILKAPIRFLAGDTEVFSRLIESFGRIGEIRRTPLSLESILSREEKALTPTGTGTTQGKVSVDVNFKGGIGLIDNVQSTSEGDVELNTGQNLAFTG